jgi:uncharacterized protein (TIGR03437 family)
MLSRFFFKLAKKIYPVALLTAAGVAVVEAQTNNPTYRFVTTLGNIDFVLTPNVAPLTVANFLSYVNAGAYTNTIFNLAAPMALVYPAVVNTFVQAGSYTDPGALPLASAAPVAIARNAPIMNEFSGVSNTQGTIAMALVSNSSGIVDPNSATSEWFFNIVDNGPTFDSLLYTVFGQTNAAGIAVMNKLGAAPITDYSAINMFTQFGQDFSSVPTTGGNFILVTSIVPVPTFTSANVTSAASFAASSANGVSPGELLAIFGNQMGPAKPVVAAITNDALPTSLAGTTVTFDSKPAPLFFTSAGQINVVVPYSIAGLPSVDITVTYNGIASNVEAFQVKAANPAIFTLNGSGTGDAVIERYPGYASDVISASNPAKPGDVLILYGEGYGAPASGTSLPDGEIVGSTVPAVADLPAVLLIDGNPVATSYFGGAPGLVNGVLQINFAVPQLTQGSHQIQLQLGSPARISPMGVTLQTM